MSSASLKSLQTRLSKAKDHLKALNAEKNDVTSRISQVQSSIKSLEADIERFKKRSKGIVVSEHAMLRYLERVNGIDLKALAEAVLPETGRKVAESLGNGTYPVETHRVKVRDGVVVTVLTDSEKD